MICSALGRAVFQAEGMLKYPQEALRADRNSARKAFSFSSIQEALISEHKKGVIAIEVYIVFIMFSSPTNFKEIYKMIYNPEFILNYKST